MALFTKGITECALSGKLLTGEDDTIGFPPFECEPGDPISVCDDACVLRREFEGWEYRADMLAALKAYRSNYYHQSSAFKVLYEDNFYLVVQSLYEDKLRVFFFQHAFVLDMPESRWGDLLNQLSQNGLPIRLNPYSGMDIFFKKQGTGITLSYIIEEVGIRDSITIPSAEWKLLQDILADIT